MVVSQVKKMKSFSIVHKQAQKLNNRREKKNLKEKKKKKI
jgi:hypothetical protein